MEENRNWEVFCWSLHQKENELYLQWLIYIYFDLWHRPRVAFYCEDEGDREDFGGGGPNQPPNDQRWSESNLRRPNS